MAARYRPVGIQTSSAAPWAAAEYRTVLASLSPGTVPQHSEFLDGIL